MPLIARFIDDLFGILLMGGKNGMAESELNDFENDMNNFGILIWEVENPSKSVTYLDLTIEIDGNSFITRTYQKPYNLYQYISPNSAHPSGMIKGVIHSMLRQYYHQNSRKDDYWKIAILFYKR